MQKHMIECKSAIFKEIISLTKPNIAN